MSKYTNEQVDTAVMALGIVRGVLNKGIDLFNEGIVKADEWLNGVEASIEAYRPTEKNVDKDPNPFSAAADKVTQAAAEASVASDREENLEWLRTWFLSHEGEYESNEQIEKVLRRETTQDDITDEGLRYVVQAYKAMDKMF